MNGLNLSIILPVYNGEAFLQNTISLILKSDYKFFELIIIDDGSTDNSCLCYQTFAKIDSRVVIIKQQNSGIVSARNRGLAEAKGQYACFIDQDDIINSDTYSTLIKDITENNCDMVISEVGFLSNGVITPSKSVEKKEISNRDEIERFLLWLIIHTNMRNPPTNKISTSVWNCIFKLKLIRENNLIFKKFVNNEDDWIFLIEYLNLCNKIFLEPKMLYVWRKHDNQQTYRKKYIENLYSKRKKHKEFVDKYLKVLPINKDDLKQYYANHQARSLVMCLKNETLLINSIRSYFHVVREIKRIYDCEKINDIISNLKKFKLKSIHIKAFDLVLLNLIKLNFFNSAVLIELAYRFFRSLFKKTS